MPTRYTLVDASGRPYITATDRKALETMLATGTVRARSARKTYAIRVAQVAEIDRVKAALRTKSKPECRYTIAAEKTACAKVLETVEANLSLGKTCFCLLSWDKEHDTGDWISARAEKMLFFRN